MNNKTISFFEKTFILFGLISSICSFNSCTNFLTGSDVKDKIDRAIEIENGQPVSIKVYSSQAETFPNGDIEIKPGKDITISCKPYPAYEFIKWQATGTDEDGVISYYDDSVVTFDNPYSKESTFTLHQDITDITITPKCVNRPQVISAYPYYDTDGVLKDSRITVMFDSDMDENSIYYTSEELRQLGLNDTNTNLSWKVGLKYTLLRDAEPDDPPTNKYFSSISDVTLEDKVYGFEEIIDGQKQIKYKCISVTDRNGKSLLENYGIPRFESKKTLGIPANRDNYPPIQTQIIATVSNELYYTNNESKNSPVEVSMSTQKRWNYILNKSTDETAPQPSKGTFLYEIKNIDDNSIGKTSDNITVHRDCPAITATSITNFPHLRDKKIKLYTEVTDLDSGMPDTFKIVATRIYNENYTKLTSTADKTLSVNYTSSPEPNKRRYGTSTNLEEIDLSSILTAGDGIYKIALVCDDMNGTFYGAYESTIRKPLIYYYVNVDTTGPTATTPSITATATSSATISWTNPTVLDFAKTQVLYRIAGSTGSFTTFGEYTSTTTSKQITGLSSGTQYEFAIRHVDINGNEGNTLSITSYIRPSQFSSFTLSKHATSPTQKINIAWTYPTNPDYSGIMFFYGTDSNIANSTYDDWWAITHTTRNSTIPNSSSTTLLPGTKYYVWTVSYAGTRPASSLVTSGQSLNTGSPYCQNFTTKPNPVTNLTVSSTTASSVTLSWTNPSSGNWTGHRIYYKKSSASSYTELTSFTDSKTLTSYTISGLSAGTKYDFKVETYATDTSNLSTTASCSSYTSPNSVTNLKASAYYVIDTGRVYLSWTNPSGYYDGLAIYYKKTADTNWTYYTTASKSTTVQYIYNLGNGLYDFKVVPYIGTFERTKYEAGTNLRTDAAAPKAALPTSPEAISNIKIYNDNGQGRLKYQWTNPSSTSLYKGVLVYYSSSSTFSSSTATLIGSFTGSGGAINYSRNFDISNYKRGTSYYIYFVPYYDHATYGSTYGNPKQLSYYNYNGNMIIKGTSCSSSNLNNVITSNVSINGNTSLTGGAFTSGRNITLTKYSIGAYEITNEVYKAVMGSTPSTANTGNSYPADTVTWYQAITFCNRLSKIFDYDICYVVPGVSDWNTVTVPTTADSNWDKAISYLSRNGYHLPTEAQWEFAARGGSTSATAWSYKYSGTTDYLSQYAWYSGNANKTTHPVGQKYANRLGLYDMTGNVWEWLSDWNNSVPNGTYTNPYCDFAKYSDDANSLSKKEEKVLLKGGALDCSAGTYLEVDYNSEKNDPETKKNTYGFRICRNAICN